MIKSGSKRRNIDFNISEELYWTLLEDKCYLCGHKPYLEYGGIDRVDSNIGYTPENVKSCCKNCNFMKKNYPLDLLFSN